MSIWWQVIKRAFVWALLGAMCSALVGGACGVVTAAIWYFCSSWLSASAPGAGGIFTDVATVAGIEGCIVAGIPGLIVFFVLSFFCAWERRLLRPPLRFVLLGMVVGVILTLLGMVVVKSLLFLQDRTYWRANWPPDLLLTAMCGPAGLLLGQIAGALYTVFVAERREQKAELQRWGRIIESDYDFANSRGFHRQ